MVPVSSPSLNKGENQKEFFNRLWRENARLKGERDLAKEALGSVAKEPA